MLLIKFLQGSQKQDMTIPSWDFGIIPKGLEWRCQNREKYSILRRFLGIFKFFEGGKRPQITNLEKNIYSTFYLLKKPNNFPFKNFSLVLLHLGDNQFWLEILSLEKM